MFGHAVLLMELKCIHANTHLRLHGLHECMHIAFSKEIVQVTYKHTCAHMCVRKPSRGRYIHKDKDHQRPTIRHAE